MRVDMGAVSAAGHRCELNQRMEKEYCPYRHCRRESSFLKLRYAYPHSYLLRFLPVLEKSLLISVMASRLIACMHRRTNIAVGILLLILLILLIGVLPVSSLAVETAPRISDREIIERLTKVEAGQTRLEEAIRANAKAINQLREDVSTQINQLREDMNAQFSRIDAQFDRLHQLILAVLGAFVALVAMTIGFALWDRRTMTRPFESKVREMEEDISRDRQRLHTLLEALRALGQKDEKVAEVLRQFQLL